MVKLCRGEISYLGYKLANTHSSRKCRNRKVVTGK